MKHFYIRGVRLSESELEQRRATFREKVARAITSAAQREEEYNRSIALKRGTERRAPIAYRAARALTLRKRRRQRIKEIIEGWSQEIPTDDIDVLPRSIYEEE
jgi:hypothetical protein